jgi:hypothetical protein
MFEFRGRAICIRAGCRAIYSKSACCRPSGGRDFLRASRSQTAGTSLNSDRLAIACGVRLRIVPRFSCVKLAYL